MLLVQNRIRRFLWKASKGVFRDRLCPAEGGKPVAKLPSTSVIHGVEADKEAKAAGTVRP